MAAICFIKLKPKDDASQREMKINILHNGSFGIRIQCPASAGEITDHNLSDSDARQIYDFLHPLVQKIKCPEQPDTSALI